MTFYRNLFSKALQSMKEWRYAPVEKAIQRMVPSPQRAVWLRRYLSWRCSRHPNLHDQLCQVIAHNAHPRAVIVFTPSLDWERQLFQRPQQLALALAKRGALIFYTQLRTLDSGEPLRQVSERLYLCSVPLECFSQLDSFFVYTLTWNRNYLLKFFQPRILYDYVDEVSAFSGDPLQLARDHQILLHSADIVTTTAKMLLEEIQPTRPDALLVPNGADVEYFNANIECPPEVTELFDRQKPVIGYYGAFASWFDYNLMLQLATKRADLDFVLIGPTHDDNLRESGLTTLKNVVYLGSKPYSQLPAYLSKFDVAILPFKVNPITQATSPIKLFEYFAGGKPVVSTPLREVMQYPGVFIGRNAEEFSQQIDQAFAVKSDPGYIQRLQEIAHKNSWEVRAESILQALDQHHNRPE